MGCDVGCEKKRRIKDNPRILAWATRRIELQEKRDGKAVGRII